MKVYVAAPFSDGDSQDEATKERNTEAAIDAAETLALAGHDPYVPHLTLWWGRRHPHSWAWWMERVTVWLRVCDAMVRLPGKSKGADQEEVIARCLPIPVYNSVEAFLKEHPRG